MLMAESNAVTTRRPKKLPAIVNHDQLKIEGKVDPMIKCMQEVKSHRQKNVEDVLKKVGSIINFRVLAHQPHLPQKWIGIICYYTYGITLQHYRVTHQVVQTLPLTSKQKWNFCFGVNGRFCTT